jgi:hypothetical protein
MEALKITGMILMLFVVYSLMGNDDYHKMFDKPTIIRYDCTEVDKSTPKEVIDKCMETNERIVRVTTYKE